MPSGRAGGAPFLAWLSEHNHFYDTLVDRIVSGFPADEAPALHAELGYADRALVKGELFSLWVVEVIPGPVRCCRWTA